jgi:hypothetical protein
LRIRRQLVHRTVALACVVALVAPAAAWAVPPTTTFALDPPAAGPSGWYNVAPVVSLRSSQGGTLFWWWNAGSEQSATVVAGVDRVVGAAPEGEPVLHAYSANSSAETETPGVSIALRVDTVAPTQPASFAGLVVHNVGVVLTWDASTDGLSGLDRYAVYRRAGSSAFQPSDIIDTTMDLTYVDAPPAFGQFYYAVSAFDVADNESPLTDTSVGYYDFTAPVAPDSVTLSPALAASIAVSWSHAGTETWSYRVERSRDGGSYGFVQSVPVGTTSWTDPLVGVTPSERYWSAWSYRVKAIGPGGESGYATSLPIWIARAGTSITIGSDRTWVYARKTFVLSGVLQPGAVGDRCVVYVKRPWSGRWSYSSARLAYMSLPGGGARWWYRYRPYLHGTYSFFVRFDGDVERLGSQSGTIGVRVR